MSFCFSAQSYNFAVDQYQAVRPQSRDLRNSWSYSEYLGDVNGRSTLESVCSQKALKPFIHYDWLQGQPESTVTGLTGLMCRNLKKIKLFNTGMLIFQGSYSTWKTLKIWKNDSSFSSHGNIMEFENYEKYHGK